MAEKLKKNLLEFIPSILGNIIIVLNTTLGLFYSGFVDLAWI